MLKTFKTFAALAVVLCAAGCAGGNTEKFVGTASATKLSTEDPDVRRQAESVFSDAPIMVEVMRCESGLRQFNLNGTLVSGVAHPPDKGACQINEAVWSSTAKKMSID